MRYLSQDWINAANQAVNQAASTAPTSRLIIDQHVRGVPSEAAGSPGVRQYRIRIEGAASSITAATGDPAEAADATFRQDWETAVAVASGTTDAHQAFLLGRIRFEGDINILIEQREAFEWLEAALAPVVAATVFDEPADAGTAR